MRVDTGKGFRNGSEFVNCTVAALLESYWWRSPNREPIGTQDNALVERKTGAVIRKHMGLRAH
jgi:hypothetical protein